MASAAEQEQPGPVPPESEPKCPTPVQPTEEGNVTSKGEAGANASASNSDPEPALPPFSAHEFRQYYRLAVHMDYFHEHFRHSWNLLYQAASSGRRPAGMSLKQFIDEGLQFVMYLTMHHNFEETHIFAVLARKMSEFQNDGGGNGNNGVRRAELLQQHKEIHAGMDTMEEYLMKCRKGEADFAMATLKTKMDSWGEVLWRHLDQEVATLGAENMRRYWTIDEIRRLPM